MLVLRRKDGQWIEITHKSGDRMRIRTYDVSPQYPGSLSLAIEDDERNFAVERSERNRNSNRKDLANVVS